MRISTTAIEAVRRYLEPENEWMTESKLLAQLRGDELESPARRLGKAFGRILEMPLEYYDRARAGFDCEGLFFSSAVMAEPLGLMDYEHGHFEVKGKRAYADGHEVVAVADQVVGARILEHKTSDYFDAETYLASCQWRFLLDVLGGLSVEYLVFLLKVADDGEIKLRGIERLTVYPYPTLHDDCQSLVDQFVAYVSLRGLGPALEAHQRRRAGGVLG